MCKQLFAVLPLAAVVSGATLVLHGGLFRQPITRQVRPTAPPHLLKKRKRNVPNRLGSGPPSLGSMEVRTEFSWKTIALQLAYDFKTDLLRTPS